ncbi:transposase [Kitasatospora sp. NPDC057198]|uniref:transposase n=1 Tax=Kitasatospora sp. NPDC057198 TaxID=3346046 RepID=UPI00363885BF
MLSVVTADGSIESGSPIDETVREGARRMLAAALEAEVGRYTAGLPPATVTRLTKQWSGDHAEKAIDAFAKTCGTGWPEAVAKTTDDRDELPAFYDFPAGQWIRLRTTNPIESISAVELRTEATRGAGSPAATSAMVFELVESVRARRRAITGAHLVAPVRAGARPENGILVERPGTVAA